MIKRSLTLKEIQERDKLQKRKEKHSLNLHGSLSIPSVTNAYSIGVGFIRDWFFNKITDSVFHFEYWTVDEANYNSAFDRADMYKNLKILKPSLMIMPKLDDQWDREGLDHTLYGSKKFLQYNYIDKSFFKDPINNIFLGMDTEVIRINFNNRIRLKSRAQQLDLMKKINLNCRMGATETNYIDMDFHLPNDLMYQLAKDTGFSVTEKVGEEKILTKEITDIPKFVAYLNQHSQYPIIYKYRNITGKFEFFMRMKEMYIHIDCREKLDLDDGEQIEQTKTNYMIDQRIVLDMAVPKLYAYYSKNEHKINLTTTFMYSVFPVSNIQLPYIPDVNEKGWNKYYEIDVEEEDLSKPLEFEFEGLFNDDSDEIRLIKEIIDHNNECYISPSMFIELKLFNNGQEIDYSIDWKKFIIKTDHLMENHFTHLSMYIDRKYINDYKINLDKLSKDKYNINKD